MFSRNTGFIPRFKTITAFFIHLVLMSSSSERDAHRLKRYFLTYHKEVELVEEPVCNITVVPAVNKYEPNVNITCPGIDFVKCFLSKCMVDKNAMFSKFYDDVTCQYEDLNFRNGRTFISAPTVVHGRDGIYKLTTADQVRISCKFSDKDLGSNTWEGFGWGLGSIKSPDTDSSEDSENVINVLMIGFASMSRNVFIRRLPNSYSYLKHNLQATFMNGYNVVDNTTSTIAELYPLLSGRSEAEMHRSDDEEAFLFHMVKKHGYRTAVFENMPREHTRQRFYRGFKIHPADHVALPLNHFGKPNPYNKFCIGSTPIYDYFINATGQFFKRDDSDGRFLFTFIADFRNDDVNKIGSMDVSLTQLFKDLKRDGRLHDTLLVVFGERGPKYSHTPSYEDELEERLPLMAIRLPEAFRKRRPKAQANLERNADALATPYDVHATILDVLDLRGHWNTYKVRGVNYLRGLTLLQPTPLDRTCKEADIDPFLCSCLNWDPVGISDPNYKRVAEVLVEALNGLTDFKRSSCAMWHLKSIDWVIKQSVNQRIIQNRYSKVEGFAKTFYGSGANFSNFGSYQVQLIVSPGHAVFKATVTYDSVTSEFSVDMNNIHRMNPSKDEILCLNATHPHLNPFCYCRYNYVNI